jgi:hypothetical protein
MAGSGLPGRLPLIFRFSRVASLPDRRAFLSPVNLLSRAGTFILVNRSMIDLFDAVHALSSLVNIDWLTSGFPRLAYYTVSERQTGGLLDNL